MIEDHNIREKLVLQHLTRANGDLNQLFYKTRDNKEIIPTQMQLIVIFTVIELAANYWDQYTKKVSYSDKEVDGVGKNFRVFAKNFLFCSDNKEYKNNKFLKRLNEHKLYEFRSAAVHFYGIGVPGISVMCEGLTNEEYEEFYNERKEKNPKEICIRPQHLRKIVNSGIEIMLNQLLKNIQKAQTDPDFEKEHITGIYYIFDMWSQKGVVVEPKRK